MDLDDRALIALSLVRLGIDTLGPRTVRELGATGFGDPGLVDRVLAASGVPEFDRATRLDALMATASAAVREGRRLGLSLIGWPHFGYPPWLAQIPDPPIVLWCRGATPALLRPAIAVIGSRDASPAGLCAARRLGRDLAHAGLTVVSGLARGADGAAHLGALEGGGQTIAVLGCGLDSVYPPDHRELADRISRQGVVISEYAPGFPPLRRHFPLRNRIISGLSRAVVVVEASERSGTLITARAALEQGRDVLAVPGGIASGRHRGCHALIKDGARLVETVEDILEEVGWSPPARLAAGLAEKSLKSSQLQAIMADGTPRSVDDLVTRTGRTVAALLAELAGLELAGMVGRMPGGHFVWVAGPAMDR